MKINYHATSSEIGLRIGFLVQLYFEFDIFSQGMHGKASSNSLSGTSPRACYKLLYTVIKIIWNWKMKLIVSFV